MFQGFNESTIKYFEAIRRENSKINYKAHEQYYFEGVKEPLEELYYELFRYFGNIDSQLLSSKRRCISSAYNDARFCHEEPIKEYFLDNKYSAIDAVQRFTDAGLLELQGDKYKRDNYLKADSVLKPLLARKRLAFVKESALDEMFFSRSLLENMLEAYNSVTDIYQLVKEAL